MLRLAVAALVAVGALVPVAAAPAEAARSGVSHRVTTKAPQVGSPVVVRGTVRPHAQRRVVLQRRVDGRWRAWAHDRTDRRGRFRLEAHPLAAVRPGWPPARAVSATCALAPQVNDR